MLCVKEWFTIGNILRTHCEIHGDTLPNTWEHIAKYMGTHFQIHGDSLPTTLRHIAKYMGTCCQHKIYVQHIRGQIAITNECIWNIIDYHAHHASRSTLHLRQQTRQSCVQQRHVSQHSTDCRLACHHAKTRTSYPWEPHERKQKRRGHDYAPQQLVLKKKWKPKKLGKRTSGPYKTVQVHVNGRVTIQLRPGLTEKINIRWIITYKQWLLIKN